MHGTVSNLEVVNPSITGSGNYHGAIAGLSFGGITNCHTTGGVVNGSKYVGGIAGYCDYNQIADCYNGAKVTGTQYVGGIAGQSVNAGSIRRCFNFGIIKATGSNSYLGGIAGASNAEVSNCYNAGILDGHSYVGGITGWSTTTSLQYCYNVGYIESNTNYYVAAISNCDNNSYRPHYCYYDYQNCPLDGGLGSTSGPSNTHNVAEQLYTQEMIGDAIQSRREVWVSVHLVQL